MDVDGAERDVTAEVQPHHHHPGDPKEDDVKACNEHVRRIIPRQLGRLLGPTERRERPQCGGEPGIEDILVAPNSLSIWFPVLCLINSILKWLDIRRRHAQYKN